MKTLLSLVILFLIGAVGYLWVELKNVKQELKKDEPKVVINIHKDDKKKDLNKYCVKNVNDLNSTQDLQTLIKKDFQKLFSDIFANPQVQKQIKSGIKEFQDSLQEAINELQKNFKDLNQKGKSVLDEFIKELGAGEFRVFDDKDDYYELKIDLNHDKNAKVEIDAKDGLLYVKVTSHFEQKEGDKIIKKESYKNYIVKIPGDASLELIKSTYKDGMLYITIPKKGGQKI